MFGIIRREATYFFHKYKKKKHVKQIPSMNDTKFYVINWLGGLSSNGVTRITEHMTLNVTKGRKSQHNTTNDRACWIILPCRIDIKGM